jgi:hypothetical protein
MALVEWKGKLWPAVLFDGTIDAPPGSCGRCGGLGMIRETIDEERHDVMVPCFMCREYCKTCKEWKKKGHACAQTLADVGMCEADFR